MARLFVRALETAGATVELPSLPLTYDGQGNPDTQIAARDRSIAAAQMYIDGVKRGDVERPDIWFSYHVYYKSPDWIGPTVARSLSVPYVVAEGSHAPKRKSGPWAMSHEATCESLSAANLLLAMTAFDRVCLEWINPSRVQDFKPFIDAAPLLDVSRREGDGTLRLVSVAMMRNERKRDSYRALAEALHLVRHTRLSLTVAGDGKYRSEIERYFDGLPKTQVITFAGAVSRERLPALLAHADALAWPGIGEAYGLAYLEAQAAGLPVLGFRERGVIDVTIDGETALLSDTGDVKELAASVERLAADASLRKQMGQRARSFVAQERSLSAAGARLKTLLEALRS